MKHNFIHGFSKNNQIGSHLIGWGTKKPDQTGKVPSHFFFLFFRKIVLESKMTAGVRLTYWGSFKKHNEIVKLFIPIGEREAVEKRGHMFENLLDKIYGKSYDRLALIYFAWRVALFKFLKKPMPKINRWNRENYYFCDELYTEVSGTDMSMVSPNDLMLDMSSRSDEFMEISLDDVV